MYKEKVNWWWFLLLAGIIIPITLKLFRNIGPYYNFLNHFTITGLNPFFIYIMHFLTILILCILFKLIKNKRSYYLFGAIVILSLFVIDFFMVDSQILSEGIPRRYIDNTSNIYSGLQLPFVNIITLSILIIFLIFNFPKNKPEPV
jgi:hypothetical protein